MLPKMATKSQSRTNYSPTRTEAAAQRKAEGVAIMTFGIEQPILGVRCLKTVVKSVDVVHAPTARWYRRHAGSQTGAGTLAALGHRNIGFVSGPADLRSAQMRVAAFKQSLAECGSRMRNTVVAMNMASTQDHWR